MNDHTHRTTGGHTDGGALAVASWKSLALSSIDIR